MPPKIQMKIEEKNVCKFKDILNSFSIDEHFKKGEGGGRVSGHKSQLIKQNPNHDSWKIIFAIFENFTKHSESI